MPPPVLTEPGRSAGHPAGSPGPSRCCRSAGVPITRSGTSERATRSTESTASTASAVVYRCFRRLCGDHRSGCPIWDVLGRNAGGIGPCGRREPVQLVDRVEHQTALRPAGWALATRPRSPDSSSPCSPARWKRDPGDSGASIDLVLRNYQSKYLVFADQNSLTDRSCCYEHGARTIACRRKGAADAVRHVGSAQGRPARPPGRCDHDGSPASPHRRWTRRQDDAGCLGSTVGTQRVPLPVAKASQTSMGKDW